MQTTPDNKAVEDQVRMIKRQLVRNMNGITAEKMKEHGIVYTRNYGVAIPQIRQIAAQYVPDEKLAQCLWDLQIRETMILSTLLQPVSNFTREMALSRIAGCNQAELAEQMAMNLLCKLSYAKELAIELIYSDRKWDQITGLITGIRIAGGFSANDLKKLLPRLKYLSATDEFILYRNISTLLLRFASTGKETALLIWSEIPEPRKDSLPGQLYIYRELNDEISFLFDDIKP